MAEFIFDQRYASKLVNPEETTIRDILLNPDATEFGEALLSYREDSQNTTLILLYESRLGYYLKFFDETDEVWLSLGDDTKLGEVVMPDDWEASVGLFISIQDTWAAVQDFYKFGTRSAKIRWIRPLDVPENGNY